MKKTHHPATSVEVISEFELLRPKLERFTNKIESLLKELLESQKLEFHLIESRTKGVNSFNEKITRSSKTYKNPLSEVTDLCGLRIITFYQDHADAIGKLIQKEFIVDTERSTLHASQGAEFGYRSSHFVINLSPSRANLPEWAMYETYCAEIQVRTVLQHAWAAISHKLQYKREEDVPVALKRKLFRLSALFELADDEFVSLRDASGEVQKEITAQIAIGEHSLLLDRISLREYIKTSPVIKELCTKAYKIGFSEDNAKNHHTFEDNQRDRLSEMLHLAAIAGLRTIEDLDMIFSSVLPWAEQYLNAQYTAHGRRGRWHVTPAFICELMLIGARTNSIHLNHLLDSGYEQEIATRIYEVAKKFKNYTS